MILFFSSKDILNITKVFQEKIEHKYFQGLKDENFFLLLIENIYHLSFFL